MVGCFNHTTKKAKVFAKKHDCRVYETLDEMLADPDIDVVNICTPSGAHMEPGVAAAKAGKHVVIEKPLEVTLKLSLIHISEPTRPY